MKKNYFILIIFIFLFSFQIKADQLAFLTKDQAEKTVDYLEKKNEVLLWCACCDDVQNYSGPEGVFLVQFEEVGFEHTGFDQNYQVFIIANQEHEIYSNKKVKLRLDLAYTHIIDKGIAYTLGTLLGFDCDPCTEPFNVNFYNAFSKKGLKKQEKLAKNFIKTIAKNSPEGIDGFFPDISDMYEHYKRLLYLFPNDLSKEEKEILNMLTKHMESEILKSKRAVTQIEKRAEINLSNLKFKQLVFLDNPKHFNTRTDDFTIAVISTSLNKEIAFRLKCNYIKNEWVIVGDIDTGMPGDRLYPQIPNR